MLRPNLWALMLPFVLVTSTADARDIQALGKDIANLRVEVERLAAEVRIERSQAMLELRTLEARKGEMELMLDAEQVGLQELKAETGRLRDTLDGDAKQNELLAEQVQKSLALLKTYIQTTLPYHKSERVAAVDSLASSLQSGKDDAQMAATKLWRLYEDELQLTHDIERGEVVVAFENEERLVPAARIGMVALFTQLGEERYGRVVRYGDGSFKHELLTEFAHIQDLRKLFKALERRVHEGEYVLPLLAEDGGL